MKPKISLVGLQYVTVIVEEREDMYTNRASKFIPYKRLCINDEFLVKFIQGFCYVVAYATKDFKDSYVPIYGMQLWITM